MAASERALASPHASISLGAGLPGPALGLRLLALAVVAGSAAFLPVASAARLPLIGGILVGAFLGCAQYVAVRRRARVPGVLFLIGQVGVWTFLLHASGDQRSPLFFGYLLEIPLSGVLLGRRGALIAAASSAVAYPGLSLFAPAPFDLVGAATATGFIAVTAVLSFLLIEVLERQERQIAKSHAILTARAGSLAEELRLLGDYLNGALVGLDDMGRISSINQAGLDLLGTESRSILGRPWQESLRLDARAAAAILHTLAEGTPQRGLELMIEGRGGRAVVVQAEAWTSASEEGRRTWLLLSESREDNGGSDPLRRLGEAVACVSHQIKNSLHALRGFARGIEDDLLAQGQTTESAHEMIRALSNLGELAEDVLAMSGTSRPAEPVLLRDAISSAVLLARHPRHRVEVVGPEHEIWVVARRGELIHALFNLIDNACRVSPPNEPVQVELAARNGSADVTIVDRGPGLPPGLLSFTSRAPSKEGAGFGLLASRRFLEKDGGRIEFESSPGGGTRCRVSLVAAAAPEPATR